MINRLRRFIPSKSFRRIYSSSLEEPIFGPFSESHARSLKQNGYVVVDNFLKSEVCSHFRNEIDHAHSQNLLFPNATHIVLQAQHSLQRGGNRDGIIFVEKKGIFEIDFITKPAASFPLFQSIDRQRTLLNSLAAHFPEMELNSHAIKAQLNVGFGACFPIHSDSDANLDSRQITCILYLNEDWKPSDGGALRLYPFPFEPVDIEPLAGRAVFFSSTMMLHRVLPSHRKRCCFTVWLSGQGKRSIDSMRPKLTQDTLLHVKFRKHLAKVLYQHEWRTSIEDSHVEAAPVISLLAEHANGVNLISQVFSEYLPLVRQSFPVPFGRKVPGFELDDLKWF